MLEGLDRVDWENLTHAYGPATEVPDLIRALASTDPQARETALSALYGNIFHQGTRYPASAHAVPFLLELLDDPNTPDRPALIELLLHLALGYMDAYLPLGVHPGEMFAGGETLDEAEGYRICHYEEDEELTQEQWDELERYQLLWDRNVYYAVQAGVDRFLQLAEAEELRLRMAAMYALGWFPERAADALAQVRRVLARETNPEAQANAILCLGMLAHARGDRSDAPHLEGLLQPEHPPIVQIAAAIALATMLGAELPDEAFRRLIAGLHTAPVAADAEQPLPWNEGRLVGYISLTLREVGREAVDRVVPALCQALKGIGAMESLDVTAAILELLYPDGPPPEGQHSPPTLTPLQRTALEAIGQHGAWKVGRRNFGNYGSLVSAYGFPATREQFQALLDAAGDREI